MIRCRSRMSVQSWLSLPCCGLFKRRAESRFLIVHQADYGSSAAFAATSSQLIRRIPSARKQTQSPPVCSDQLSNMDFNVKKLASDAGVFFTRAVQVSCRSCCWTSPQLKPSLDEWTRIISRCPRRKHAAGCASCVYVTRSHIRLFYSLPRFTKCEIRQVVFRGDGRSPL